MKIADYVIEEMKKQEEGYPLYRNTIWIGDHIRLNSAYLKYVKNENPKKYVTLSWERIQAAWNAVTRDKRFRKNGAYIKSVLFSDKEYKHYIYELKEIEDER